MAAKRMLAIVTVTGSRFDSCAQIIEIRQNRLLACSLPMDSHPTHSSFTSVTLLGRVRDLSDQQAWKEFVRALHTEDFFLVQAKFSARSGRLGRNPGKY